MDNKDECKEYKKYKDKKKEKNMIKRKNMRTVKILLM